MKGTKLTERQTEMLDAIRRHIKDNGLPPTRAELAQALNIANQAGVDRMLNALVKKGWVRLFPSVERGIQLLREGAPIVGQEDLPVVAAGNPNDPGYYPERERLHDFDTFSEQFESRPDYFLKVRGDSMDLVGFRSGDVVAVKRGGEPRNGDVVVARLEEEITLKRFYCKDGTTIELQPVSSNPEHSPIYVNAQTVGFDIEGIVVGAIIGTRRE